MVHAVFQTSAGWIGIRSSSQGLTDIVLPGPDRIQVFRCLGVSDEGDVDAFTDLIKRFRAYFAGEPVEFPDEVDLSQGTPFQQRVWQACRRVPRGETVSYGRLAAEAGNPNAARATGSALGKNPVPIIVPCHRVIAGDGSLGGFGGGLDMKRMLLGLEKGR